MSPQMGEYTQEDADADIAAHAALTITHGTVDDIADQTDIENHRLDADAHHSEEVPRGRARHGGNNWLVHPGIMPISQAVYAPAANQIFYMPIIVHTPITIDAVVIEVTIAGAGGTRGRVAIYNADVNWQPTTLVVATAQIPVDGVAVVTTAIAATVLQEGRYLIAYTSDINATLRLVRGSTDCWGVNPVLGVNLWTSLAYVAAAYAALPDPGTVWDTTSLATTPGPYRWVFLNAVTP